MFLEGLEEKKIYGAFEYFGEASLVSNKPTAADVTAETDVRAFTMAKDKFLNFISGTEFEATLKSLAETRGQETWNILSTSRYFRRLTSYQKTWLESVFKRVEVVNGKVLVAEGQEFMRMYVIRKGEVEVIKNGSVINVLQQGDFIGNLHEITRTLNSEYTFRTRGKVALFAVTTGDMVSFAEKNPGLIMKIKSDI